MCRRAVLVWSCGVVLLTAPAAAQIGTLFDDPRPAEISTSLTGRVVDSAGLSVAGVTVVATHINPTARAAALTDDGGRFELPLRPGTYSVRAEKRGYVAVQLPWSIAFVENRPLRDVELRTDRLGAVSGRVLDASGMPMTRVTVVAVSDSVSSSTTTDDLGAYDMPLPPGAYVVAVPGTHVRSADQRPTFRDRRDVRPWHPPLPGGSEMTYATTYYGGTMRKADATPVTVVAGRQTDEVDVTPIATPALTIAGRLTPVPGPLPREVMLYLTSLSGISQDDQQLPASADGTFAFRHLEAGRWRIFAYPRWRSRRGGPVSVASNAPFALREVTLTDRSIEDLALRLAPGPTVSGTVHSDDGTLLATLPARFGWQPLLMGYEPNLMDRFFFPLFGSIDNGRITIASARPGQLKIAADRVEYRGRDVTVEGVPVSTADVTGVVVTLSERPAVITGTVTSDRAPSFALVAMKRDERPWDDDLRPTDTAGHFELDSLAPGDYRLAALTLDEALRGDDTAVRALAESRSVRVRVAGGDAKVVSLTTGAR